MNIMNLSGFSGYLKDGKGNFIVVADGTFLGPFSREQLSVMSDLIKELAEKKEQEG